MRARFAGDSRAGLFLFLGAYAACLLALLPVLSLWLDEILDLIGVRRPTLAGLLEYIPLNPGASPLGYIPQFFTVHLLGFSVFSARLPSVIWSLFACYGVFLLARRMNLRRPPVAVAIFALFPLQLRYALEVRPYELALCLGIWATVAFARVVDEPQSVARVALYALAMAAALYTFPFTLFVAAAHLLWALWERRWRVLLAASLAVGAAGFAFAPWYLHYAAAWRQAVVVAQLKDRIGIRAIPMILREIPGAGYIGTGLLLIGVAFGIAKSRDRLLWGTYALLPILCVVAADASFGYLLAARQMIVVLAPLALLFAAGVESLDRRAAVALGAALTIALIVGDINYFRRQRENWQAAAGILAAESCVVYAPDNSRHLYGFFVPQLAERVCMPGSGRRVALAISPYVVGNPSADLQRQLEESGYLKQAELNPATPRIEIYQKR
jgi:4-amino-4-deoxy-L-arabinose transferase-like glycosyltransferase